MWYSTVAGIMTLILSLLAPLRAAEAQPPGTVPRIGILIAGTAASSGRNIEAFQQGLRDLGYVEGQNIAIEYRWAEGQGDRFPAFVAEFVHLKVDLIVAPGGRALQAAQHATNTIPIVVSTWGTPVMQGSVTSIARPGGNITGLSTMSPELSGKRLELLKEAVPGLSRVAILWQGDSPGNSPLDRQALEAAGRTLGLQMQSVEVREARGSDDFAAAFAAATRERAEVLILTGSSYFFVERRRIADLTTQSHLPAMFPFREGVEAGGLMAYGPSIPDLYRRAATYVDKILKGAKPADLPVEQPMKF